jgi:broad specificity phosphatase PhoE
MKVYFIRHGQTTCNAAEKHQGWGPISLSEKGFEQALAAREHIEPIKFDRIFSSDLLRTRQTSEIIFPDEYRSGNIIFDSDIREIDTGAFYGKTVSDLYPLFGDEYMRRRKDMDYAALGAEGSAHFRARVEKFLKKLESLSDLDKIAVVAHGGVIRAAVMIISGYPREVPIGRFPMRTANCSVHVFGYTTEQGWWIDQLNYKGSLS